ncbi:MAG: metallophosphoesterase family protein [Planctomycetes bacterium]|nr:metallophosphoesterase family protein [Planctomycetota bacterium]
MEETLKYGLIADPHANYEALSVAVSHLIEQEVHEFLCMGDIVGYNASPVQVIELLQEVGAVCINGNHDRYLLGQPPEEVGPEKVYVVEWTRRQLGDVEMDFLRALPTQREHAEGILMVHGSPQDMDEYLLTKEAIQKAVRYLGQNHPATQVCFFGHSHIPMIIGEGRIEMNFQETRTVRLNRMRSYLINVGSVGQPRDKCRKTSFGIFDSEAYTISIIRLDYDVEAERARIIEAGIDRRLANRLLHGV